jgi:cyclic pyranopterin phosphate synthase
MIQRTPLSEIIKIATWWRESGGSSKVEVAALEPMLWRDNAHNVCDVVKELKELGFIVSMTTNGTLLSKYSEPLKKSGLDLLRVSWHSLDDETFKKITGGGILNNVKKGIISAIENEIDVKINRVLLKGHTDDLCDQIEFINLYKVTLKILDLYWTQSSADLYQKYYISPQDALFKCLSKLDLIYMNSENNAGRSRIKYKTKHGGIVEYKIKESAEKTHKYCMDCSFKNECLEGYGDYFRVFPDTTASLCYLRKDLATKDHDSIFKENIPLRFVLEGRCNFNCGFPDSEVSWCLKQGRGFKFPNRFGVVRIEHKR